MRRRFKTKLVQRLRMRKNSRRYARTAHGAYQQQQRNAKRRGIAWQFTFESWWKLWSDSGYWAQHGRRRGFYCMARLGDVGPYSPANCRIVEYGVNCQAAAVTARIVPAASVPAAVGLFADCPF